ncbi:hypothetical protein DTW90_34580 [Neorhizobium sp. P12A]|uniref:hypothetical protein n=1 Tax=Neorhizobium sp. P12A TaxID=2268027 RepID=UPI0011ECEBA3|nr:hypothetical protein [Neorhizobium sp. P12A]KAA0686015.1 hypothetical protein DTW90_34580 [Neorhizobium sp. P12A]
MPTETETVEDLIKTARTTPSEDIARRIMTEAGAGASADMMGQVLKGLGVADDIIQKTISTSTGLVAFDLQAPAKNLYPVATPIRNRLPRVGGGTGTATNWRQVNAIIGSGFDAMGWVPEGQRSGQMSYSTSSKAASYATLGEEDAITYEAIHAARGFEDAQARMTMRLLQKTFLKEEFAVMGGNNSLQLGTPVAAVLSAGGSGATLPALTYSVIVVALTLEGYANSVKLAGSLSIPTTKTITGADGKTFTLNGGSSNKSASATQVITLGQVLSASVTPISGAVGYAWFVGAVGSETLQAITTVNSATFSAPLTGGAQAATTVTADSSTNSTAFDGLLTAGFKPANGAQVITLPTGTAGVGTVLTASGKGSVVEIDNLLLSMWNAYQVSPSVIYVNAQELKNITTKVLQGSSAPLLQYFADPKQGEYRLAAGGTIEFYFNPFMLDGGMKIPIKIHPNLPPGTILAWAENLPVQYQSNEVPNVAEIKTRQDFYQIDWPIVTRQRQVGVYVEEVLALYAPFAIGIITNIANG